MLQAVCTLPAATRERPRAVLRDGGSGRVGLSRCWPALVRGAEAESSAPESAECVRGRDSCCSLAHSQEDTPRPQAPHSPLASRSPLDRDAGWTEPLAVSLSSLGRALPGGGQQSDLALLRSTGH